MNSKDIICFKHKYGISIIAVWHPLFSKGRTMGNEEALKDKKFAPAQNDLKLSLTLKRI